MEGDVFMAKGQSQFGDEVARELIAWTPGGHCRQLCELNEKISMRLRREPPYHAQQGRCRRSIAMKKLQQTVAVVLACCNFEQRPDIGKEDLAKNICCRAPGPVLRLSIFLTQRLHPFG